MFGIPVRDLMNRKKLVVAAPTCDVARAARMMVAKRVGAIVVVDEGRLVGIFTERDALFRIVAKKRDPAKTLLEEVMTPEPKTIGPGESFGVALLLMNENGFRHLPVTEKGVVVGIVSSRAALDPKLEEFRCEQERRIGLARERLRHG
jgi:CBS domain-containing protein